MGGGGGGVMMGSGGVVAGRVKIPAGVTGGVGSMASARLLHLTQHRRKVRLGFHRGIRGFNETRCSVVGHGDLKNHSVLCKRYGSFILFI